MKAIDAHKLANQFNNRSHNEQIVQIEELINSAAQKGEFAITYFKPMLDSVVAEFRKQGFSVQPRQTGPNETGVDITWHFHPSNK